MLIKIRHDNEVLPSEITAESVYQQRRQFIKQCAQTTLATSAVLTAPHLLSGCSSQADNSEENIVTLNDSPDFTKVPKSKFSTDEELTPFEPVTTYNNFLELGTGKRAPARNADQLITHPWTIEIEGEVEKPLTIDMETILKQFPLEERIYRLRCVETWSMVVPWIGFPLNALIKYIKPTSEAQFVEFQSIYDPIQLPAQQQVSLEWPYLEGLRMDEAMHPLTILSVGLYGQILPNQNGAPLRLVVPWKYGFKSIKSIVKIRFLSYRPLTTWEKQSPGEYGFYSNVNPQVSHPRWNQKKERRIGEFFKRHTQLFNGYAEEVADLYKDMDLNKYF